MHILKNNENLNEIIANKKNIIVQFGEKRCLPCQDIKNKISAWVKNKHNIDYLYVPFEEFQNIAADRGVFVVPAIFVYIEGKLTLQVSGYFSLDEILSKTEYYLDIIK